VSSDTNDCLQSVDWLFLAVCLLHIVYFCHHTNLVLQMLMMSHFDTVCPADVVEMFRYCLS
jgi:TRAP-type uncharacterized transport system fused permease subunit